MITVENYKAFHGVMRITPKTKCVTPLEIEGDWLYKPEYKCWYGNGASYGEDICTVVRDDSEKEFAKKLLPDNRYYGIGMCPTCGVVFTSRTTKHCGNCGQKLDWGDT